MATAPLRVLVVARQPIARAGLRGILAELDDVLVVDQVASAELAETVARELRPDAILASWEPDDTDRLAALAESLDEIGVALVLLGTSPSPAELAVVLRAGARGVLLAEATAEEVGVALRAVAHGLLVLDPVLARALPEATPVARPVRTPPAEPLTEREREVLQLLALGLPNKAIARRLGVTEHTVKFHVGSILAKLGAGSRTEAVTRAAQQGLLAL